MTPEVCLALAIYFEARGEPYDGQLAVADVVMERVEDNRYPDSICGVIFEPEAFSFTIGGTPLPKDRKVYSGALKMAQRVLSNGETLGLKATHYHTPKVNPQWKEAFEVVGRVGNHVFYLNDTPYK